MPEKTEAVVYDTNDPRSVLRLVSESFRAAILSLPPEFRDLSEREYQVTHRPSAQENRLRMSFWREYDVAQEMMVPINMTGVYAGICTRDYFYGVVLRRPNIVGWMIIPPAKYEVMIEEALDFGIGKLREIMDLPLTDSKGRVNVRLCDTIIRATAMLDMRMRGAYVQRSEHKNLNFNMQGDTKDLQKLAAGASMEEIETRIRNLESKGKRLAKAAALSDIEVSAEKKEGE